MCSVNKANCQVRDENKLWKIIKNKEEEERNNTRKLSEMFGVTEQDTNMKTEEATWT